MNLTDNPSPPASDRSERRGGPQWTLWISPGGAAVIRRVLPLALLALALLPVDTSCTAPPHCAAGQTAQRMPSHQRYMWTCAPGGPAS